MLTRPDRKQELRDQRLHFGRRNKAKQELSCNVSGESSVDAVKMPAFGLRKNGMETKQEAKLQSVILENISCLMNGHFWA